MPISGVVVLSVHPAALGMHVEYVLPLGALVQVGRVAAAPAVNAGVVDVQFAVDRSVCDVVRKSVSGVDLLVNLDCPVSPPAVGGSPRPAFVPTPPFDMRRDEFLHEC